MNNRHNNPWVDLPGWRIQCSAILMLVLGSLSCVSPPADSFPGDTLSDTELAIQSLGVAGLKIQSNRECIYVDAFAQGVGVSDYGDATILLITHGDQDHFMADKVEDALANSQAVVVAPLGVIQSIDEGYSPRLILLEPGDDSVIESLGSVEIRAYRTTHFNDHPEANNSYAIAINGKNIFISGDTLDFSALQESIYASDLLVLNYLDWNLDSTLGPLLRAYPETHLFISHLITCSWSMEPGALIDYKDREGIENLTIHRRVGETLYF